jgi:ABC-type branched-subunit amino acid transport system substrate-binding protein
MHHHRRLAAALTAGLLAGCQTAPVPGTAASQATVKIGFIAPITGEGDTVVITEHSLNGIKLALEQVNAAGGVNGQKLEVISKDEPVDPAQAVQGAKELEASGVVAIIGPTNEVGPEIVKQVTQPARLPLISPAALAPHFESGGTFFQTIPQASYLNKAMVDAIRPAGHKKVAVLANKTLKDFAEEFTALFNAAVGPGAATLLFYEGERPDWAALSAQVPAGTTAYAPYAYFPDAVSLMRDWIASGQNPAAAWYLAPPHRDDSFAANVGDATRLTNVKGISLMADGAFAGDFRTAYRTRFGKEPGYYADRAYDTVMLIALALTQGQANTRKAVLDHVTAVSAGGTPQAGFGQAGFQDAVAKIKAGTDLDYSGASGDCDLGSDGQLLHSRWVVWTWDNGKTVDTATTLQVGS